MHYLSLKCIPSWTHVAGRWCPSSIDSVCPHCDKITNFPLGNHSFDASRETISASANCPACRGDVHFWIHKPSDASLTHRSCSGLYIFPHPRAIRQSVLAEGLIEVPALERAYISAIRAYNAGLWDACAMSCRKTLEGIVHTRLPDSKDTLFAQLKTLFSSPELMAPLIHLADTLRKGGNLGAHFDLEKTPDREIATLMLDLLDFIMGYLYQLQNKSSELETRLKNLNLAT